jgi:hypothetical protein
VSRKEFDPRHSPGQVSFPTCIGEEKVNLLVTLDYGFNHRPDVVFPRHIAAHGLSTDNIPKTHKNMKNYLSP